VETNGELTERQQYWLDHIQACEESGDTTKAYAEVHGLSVSMMYSWRKELTMRGVWSIVRTKALFSFLLRGVVPC